MGVSSGGFQGKYEIIQGGGSIKVRLMIKAVLNHWPSNERGECLGCGSKEAEYKAVMVNEYGVKFVGAICTACLRDLDHVDDGLAETVAALGNLVKEVRSQKRRTKSYRVVNLLSQEARTWHGERRAAALSALVEILSKEGFEVSSCAGRHSGHYHVRIVKDRDLPRLEKMFSELAGSR